MKNLYSELSKYVHSSYRGEWVHVSERGTVETKFLFEIDEKLLKISARFMIRVFDAILYLLIKRFPTIIKGLREDIVEELRRLGINKFFAGMIRKNTYNMKG
ncbi:MAG: hypothetical protein ACTSUJ_05495 [Candidatus Njordarchaeales archaeon]